MKFSEEWLRELVNPSLDIFSLCSQITKSGLEVENIEKLSGDFDGVIVGEIVSCVVHPSVKKLFLLQVNVGLKKNISIVSNAFNCRFGIKVAVALVGSFLPDLRRVSSTVIKGMLSEGILCSFSELHMISFHQGIIELPVDAEVGLDIKIFFSDKENLISVSINPNRSDELSIIGLSREVAVLNKLPLPIIKSEPVKTTINDFFSIKIYKNTNCTRYFGRIIKNIDIKKLSPFWLKEKLRRSNFASNNVVIDVINYCMIMFGQLFHIFDADKINDSIIVRKASLSDKCILSDGSIISLKENDIIISDHENVLSLNGIINTKFSMVTENTKNIFLGCISFPLDCIDISSYLFQLNYDFCYRFNKGIDPFIQNDVMEYITKLLIRILGGGPGPIVDQIINYNLFFLKFSLILHLDKLKKILGYSINHTICSNILCTLGYTIIFSNHYIIHLIVPSWRFDVLLEEDVISDIIRIYGYDKHPSLPIQENISIVHINKLDLYLNRIKLMLVDKGYYEVITYSFIDPKVQKLFFSDQKFLLISNPISEDMSVMRFSLWPGLLTVLIYNKNRQQQSIKLFEVGLCFSHDDNHELNVKQENHLSGIISGYFNNPHWDMIDKKFDFYDLKGDIESILDINNNLNYISFKNEIIEGFHPGQSSGIYYLENRIGCIGVLHPTIQNKLNLNNNIIMFNIKYDQLRIEKNDKIINFSSLPFIQRDISIIIKEDINVSDVISFCKNSMFNKNTNIELLNIYRDNEIGIGKKSLSIRLTFDNVKTMLKEKEINFMVNEYVLELQKKFKAIFRS